MPKLLDDEIELCLDAQKYLNKLTSFLSASPIANIREQRILLNSVKFVSSDSCQINDKFCL